MLHKDYYRKGSVGKKSLVVGLKGLHAKTNWSAINRQSWSNFDSDFWGLERIGTRSCERQENSRENQSSEVLRELSKKNYKSPCKDLTYDLKTSFYVL
jgi:hypothetical protein